MEVGVNSSFVALIATESVSVAIPWPLLPLEVGVNRHGQINYDSGLCGIRFMINY